MNFTYLGFFDSVFLTISLICDIIINNKGNDALPRIIRNRFFKLMASAIYADTIGFFD